VTGAWERAAAAEARRRGLPLDAADHVFYDLPRRPCFWAGMAYICERAALPLAGRACCCCPASAAAKGRREGVKRSCR
jgi:hypothetical protein